MTAEPVLCGSRDGWFADRVAAVAGRSATYHGCVRERGHWNPHADGVAGPGWLVVEERGARGNGVTIRTRMQPRHTATAQDAAALLEVADTMRREMRERRAAAS